MTHKQEKNQSETERNDRDDGTISKRFLKSYCKYAQIFKGNMNIMKRGWKYFKNGLSGDKI